MKLRYLFEVEFADGTKLKQTQEDKSEKDEKRNAFYDVLTSGKQLKTITYLEQKLWNPTTVVIDYLTGKFTVNGLTLFPEPGLKIGNPIREMIVQQHTSVKYNIKTKVLLSTKQLAEDRYFYVGYETDKGNKVIGIK